MGGSRKGGRRGGRNAATDYLYSPPLYCRFPSFEHPTVVRTRFHTNPSLVPYSSTFNTHIHQLSTSIPISNDPTLNSDASTAEEHKISVSTVFPISASFHNHKKELAIIMASPFSQHNDPQLDPQSSFGYVNVTEFAQNLREDMEDDPEEEVESALDPAFVYVHEHRVKIEHANLVRAMFEIYGDITKGSNIKSPGILYLLLQHVCVMYNNLKETKFFHVTLIELENMLAEVRDLEGQKMNVGWLRERIESVIKTRIDFGKYLAIKEGKSERETSIKRLEKKVSLLQQQLCAVQKQLEKVKCDGANELALDIRGRIVDHTTRSLVHGLLLSTAQLYQIMPPDQLC